MGRRRIRWYRHNRSEVAVSEAGVLRAVDLVEVLDSEEGALLLDLVGESRPLDRSPISKAKMVHHQISIIRLVALNRSRNNHNNHLLEEHRSNPRNRP